MRLPLLLLAFVPVLFAPAAAAQSGSAARSGSPSLAQLRDGVFRRQGQTMRLRAGRASRLTAPLMLENDATVSPSGVLTAANGRRQQLPNNYAVTMQGNLVLLRDDMLTPRAIAEQAQTVTGSTGEARFEAPISAATNSQVPPRLAAKLLCTEQRLAVLEDMTLRLERRTQARSAALAPLNQQLSAVNAELQQGAAGSRAPAPNAQ